MKKSRAKRALCDKKWNRHEKFQIDIFCWKCTLDIKWIKMHTKNYWIFYQFDLEIDKFIIPEVILKKRKKSHKALFALENFPERKGPYVFFT